jgi:hypothetical protein
MAIQNITTSLLPPSGFKFILLRAPHLNFTVQQVNVPGVTAEPPRVETPFMTLPLPGARSTYNPLSLSFKVTENFENYLEILEWIHALSPENNFRGYRTASAKGRTFDGLTSDIDLTILQSSMLPSINFKFVDAMPTSLSDLTFDTTVSDVDYITATVEFMYSYYEHTII